MLSTISRRSTEEEEVDDDDDEDDTEDAKASEETDCAARVAEPDVVDDAVVVDVDTVNGCNVGVDEAVLGALSPQVDD